MISIYIPHSGMQTQHRAHVTVLYFPESKSEQKVKVMSDEQCCWRISAVIMKDTHRVNYLCNK